MATKNKITSNEVRKRLCDSFANGSSRKDASRIIGVERYTTKRVIKRYLLDGDKDMHIRGGRRQKK
jgi:transposase